MSERADFLNSGWDWLTPEGQAEDPDREKREQQSQVYADMVAAFDTPHGMRVLGHLANFVYLSPGFDPALGYETGVAQGFAREGQRALVAYIYQCLERGRKERSDVNR